MRRQPDLAPFRVAEARGDVVCRTYCYRTLAYSTCYAQPLDRREANRVVGYYGPSPGRIVAAPPPALPQEKMGPATEYPPLMVPRDKVESEPLQLVPPKEQLKLEAGTD